MFHCLFSREVCIQGKKRHLGEKTSRITSVPLPLAAISTQASNLVIFHGL